MPDDTKKKLTLSVNENVIKKAKELGISLSDVTEKALKITSFGHENEKLVTPDILRKVNLQILKELIKIIKKWEIQFRIGSYTDYEETITSGGNTEPIPVECEYYLLPSGRVELWLSDFEVTRSTWELDDPDLPVINFDDPDKIISRLVDKLYDQAKENKERLQKLSILKNIIELSGLTLKEEMKKKES